MVFCLFRAIYLGHPSGFSNVQESVIIFLTSLNYVHQAGNVALNMSVAFFDKINLKKNSLYLLLNVCKVGGENVTLQLGHLSVDLASGG